ncbi:TPA: ead/Ea22-like family protein, partial [Klebsiella pneumoniae]
MTTDITELAQSEINDALAQLKQISEYPTPSTQYARVLRKYIATLVEALEKSEKASEARREAIDITHKRAARERDRANAAEE